MKEKLVSKPTRAPFNWSSCAACARAHISTAGRNRGENRHHTCNSGPDAKSI